MCYNLFMKFGAKMRELRKQNEIGIKTLARSVKVNHAYLSRIEAGHVKPSEQIVRKLAKVLKHEEAELMLLADYVPPAWKGAIHKSPQVTSSVIRDALNSIQMKNTGEVMLFEELYAPPVAPPIKAAIKPETILGDCIQWLDARAENSVHAVITDPPFALVEYSEKELSKMRSKNGGIWRLPPTIGGCVRKPLPRFTVLSSNQLNGVQTYFERWGKSVMRVIVPGGHLMVASNPLVVPFVSSGLISAGFEMRGTIIRLVRTMRGGDRPKLAETEFNEVSVIPRACYEPWLLFRKPLSEKTVAANLRRWKTGGLRRTPDEKPFPDVIKSEFPLSVETEIAPHPSLKPQRLMRQLAWASLPLGEGTILDPFMGSGSTVAAASALGYKSIGIELDAEFMRLAEAAIPKLQQLQVPWQGFETSGVIEAR